MVKAKANEIQYMHFTVFDTDGITPLTGQAGSCTSSLRKDGAITAESVTIAEIGATGRYYASFTPLAVADYDLEVTCSDGRVMGENWETEVNDLDDLASDISTVDGKVDTIDSNVDDILTDTADIQPKVDTINTRVDQSISTTESNIRGADSDDLKTISDQIDLIDTDISSISTDLLEIKALNRKNTVIENTFDTTNKHTGFIMYCYDSVANKQLHDKVTGLLYRFQLDVTYDSNNNPTIIEKESL